MESSQKLTNIKKDARLTIRIPRELKAKIDGIDQVYASRCPRLQTNVSGHFAITLSK